MHAGLVHANRILDDYKHQFGEFFAFYDSSYAANSVLEKWDTELHSKFIHLCRNEMEHLRRSH